MNSVFLGQVKEGIQKFGVRMPLIVGVDDITVSDIAELLTLTQKVCVVTDQFFLMRQLSFKFRDDGRGEVCPPHAVKAYPYDAMVCGELFVTTLSVLTSFPTIAHVFLRLGQD